MNRGGCRVWGGMYGAVAPDVLSRPLLTTMLFASNVACCSAFIRDTCTVHWSSCARRTKSFGCAIFTVKVAPSEWHGPNSSQDLAHFHLHQIHQSCCERAATTSYHRYSTTTLQRWVSVSRTHVACALAPGFGSMSACAGPSIDANSFTDLDHHHVRDGYE